MAKPSGFYEYDRALPKDRDIRERVKDWNEFHTHFETKDIIKQAARCMDCGTPFCHSGLIYDGAASGCPIYNLIPEWNDLAYKGIWMEASRRLRLTNNFPEFTGRVCPAPCEGACTVAGINREAVAIKQIEVSIIDKAWEEGWIKPSLPTTRTGKKIAIIGSGPSGLACADQLNHAGHSITVYEKSKNPGGILSYGIPNMKLDKKIIKKRIDLMKSEGVTFITDYEVDSEKIIKIQRDCDAIIIASGSTVARDINVPGRDSQGIYFAMDYLSDNNREILNEKKKNDISAKGLNVVVIGGGDTGTDCLASSIRQGAKSLVQLEIMPTPPSSRTANNPWPRWPRIFKTDYGQEEAIKTYGSDPRLFETTVKKFNAIDNKLSSISIVNVSWEKDDRGNYVAKEKAESERSIPADMALIAMGFVGPEKSILKTLNIIENDRGLIKTANGKYATNINKIFSCGDCRRGQSLVVWAIKEGREAAREVDEYLMGSSKLLV